jgi:hypothetical protein
VPSEPESSMQTCPGRSRQNSARPTGPCETHC